MNDVLCHIPTIDASKANCGAPPIFESKVPHTSASPAPPVHRDATGVDIERCRSIITLICDGINTSSLQVLDLKQVEFNDVSPREHEYIMRELEGFNHLAIRFTSFLDLNKITLMVPSPVREALINIIISALNRATNFIPH
ncbi:hypothetical protein BDN67DRAFT_1016373 [Paxillus ammoniavirescens]|nr:hypothetical protein BDN67DRAFT_1016373 [Paxillus ammoniavirescens]